MLAPNWNNADVSDIILQVGENKYHVQKMVVCMWSEVFHTMMADPKWANNNVLFEDGKVKAA